MFKKDCLTIKHDSGPLETFALDNGIPFSSYTHDGCEKVCLNCWVDFVDIDDSEIVGGSEVYVLIYGLRITKAALKKKGTVVVSTAVSSERDEEADVSALLFANEFHRISELHFETLGQGRFQVHVKVEDITEMSDAFNTDVWVAGKLGEELPEMEYPE